MRSLVLVALLAACGGTPEPVAPPVPPVEAAPVEAAPAPAAPGRVTVTTTKKGTVEDAHTVDVDVSTLKVATPWDPSTLTGSLTLRADTWTSAVPDRDTRVKAMFLDTAAHPTAAFEVASVEGFGPLAPDARAEGVVKGTLALVTGRVPVEAKVAIVRTAAGLDVSLVEPVVISAEALGLGGQLRAVADACGVPLADTVKVAAAFTIPQG